MQRVVREVVARDVRPHVALGPGRERVRLPEPVALVPVELLGARARSGDWSRRTPEIQQSASSSARCERLDLAQEAAAVGLGRPEAVDPLAAIGLDRDAVALLDRAPGGVGLLEQHARVEREDARARGVAAHDVDQHRGLLLPRGGEREPLLAEAFDCVEDDLCGAGKRHRT